VFEFILEKTIKNYFNHELISLFNHRLLHPKVLKGPGHNWCQRWDESGLRKESESGTRLGRGTHVGQSEPVKRSQFIEFIASVVGNSLPRTWVRVYQ